MTTKHRYRLIVLVFAASLLNMLSFTEAQTQGIGRATDIFAGYSRLWFDSSDSNLDTFTMNGIHMEWAWAHPSQVGFSVEFTYHTGQGEAPQGANTSEIDVKQWSFAAGPRWTLRSGPFKTSFRVMIGFADGTAQAFELNSETATVNIAESSFIFVVGSNIDVSLSDRITLRLLQPDYQISRFGSDTETSFRLATGLVFH